MSLERRERAPQKQEFVHKEILPNGLRVLVHEMPWSQSVTARLLVKAGPRYENNRTAGTAHFLEHMFFEGSNNYPSRRELDRAIESRGGKDDGMTNMDYVWYQAKLPPENRDFATKYLRELLFNPVMSEKAVETERGIIEGELRRSIDEIEQKHRWNLLHQHVWKGHPLGKNNIGTFESIKHITLQDLNDYHARFYRPNNSILTLAGNISTSEAVDLAARDFGDLPSISNTLPNVRAPMHSYDSPVLVEERNLNQTHILLAFDTKGNGESSNLSTNIKVFTKILSDNIFYKFVSDLGLCYSAGSFPRLAINGGNIVAITVVNPEKTQEAIKIMVYEVNNLEINDKSVEEAKAGIIRHTLLDLSDTDKYADFIVEQELYNGTVKSPEQVKAKINAVSTKDIQRTKEMFIDGSNPGLIVIGPVPQNKAKDFESMLIF